MVNLRAVAFYPAPLQVFRYKAGVLGNSGHHSRPDFLSVMECPHVVTTLRVRKNNV